MVGFSNGTLTMNAAEDDRYAEGEVRWRDFLLSTPATLLLYYAILLITVTTFGCFSSSGAQRCCNISVSVYRYMHTLNSIPELRAEYLLCNWTITS